MSEAQVCAGCCVYPPVMDIPHFQQTEPLQLFIKKEDTITSEEKAILNLLASAWNIYKDLHEKHPQENSEFLDAIHRLQHIIGYRVARRVDKNVWTQYESGEGS